MTSALTSPRQSPDPLTRMQPTRRFFTSRFYRTMAPVLLIANFLIIWRISHIHSIEKQMNKAYIGANWVAAGLKGYHSEYGHLPASASATLLTAGPDAAALLNALTGRGGSTGENPRQMTFVAFADGTPKEHGFTTDPATGALTGLYDPWGRPYHLYLDTTSSGSVRLPSGETLPGKLAVIISDGPDGKPGTRDDVRSDQFPPIFDFW